MKWFIITIFALIILGCVAPEEKAPPPAVKIKATDLKELRDLIDNGLIDVGKDYGLESYQRFHKIHHDTLGLECSSCHVAEKHADDVMLLNRYTIDRKVEEDVMPGIIDKSVCLGCHKTGGVAPEFYGSYSD
jgi:hypothetical protein